MRSLLAISLLFLSIFSAKAQENKGVTVSVVLENVLSEQGEILAALHTSETFMKGMGIDGYETQAKKGQLVFSFTGIQPGVYAISIMQDLNSNQRMDFEENGMPKEPYAMTGTMSMGPPSFQDASFEVGTEDLEIRIRF
ncbi:DUF2141 domain-containing protein [Robiginitalea sp. IMCC43444]|uniref:DUF2141 domain-containing protein n=1 Tax=Robiginitalea sp. IMCC43444 TaxID=3459121 RepID=UPI0040425C3F